MRRTVTTNQIPKLVKKASQYLAKKRQTLALAESCTGGLISSEITKLSGASKIFLGSVVSYSNFAKSKMLGVSAKLIKKHGAVSYQVALEMARGAKKNFKSDWSVSVTGIAGPKGGSPDKPVGLVFVAICGPQLEEVSVYRFRGPRNTIQKLSTQAALKMLVESF